MAKTWSQILDEIGKVPPEQTMRDKEEMLREKGMTSMEFSTSKEHVEEARRRMAYRFSSPEVFRKK